MTSQKQYYGQIYRDVWTVGQTGRNEDCNYIGQTRHPDARYRQHRNKNTGKRNLLWWRMYEKYGEPVHEILEEINEVSPEKCRQVLNELESKYIKEYHATSNEGGANLTSGGNHPEITDVGRKHMSENRPNKRKVLMFDKDGNFIMEFESTCDAAKFMGSSPANIHSVCKGTRANGKKSQIHKGMIFRFADQFETLPDKINTNITEGNKAKCLQYDKEGNFIKLWNSIREAERMLGICGIRFNKKTAGGYQWRKYEGEIIPQKIETVSYDYSAQIKHLQTEEMQEKSKESMRKNSDIQYCNMTRMEILFRNLIPLGEPQQVSG